MASNPPKPQLPAVGPSSQDSGTGDGLITGSNGIRYHQIQNPVQIPISQNVADHLTSNGFVGRASGNSQQPQSGQTSTPALPPTASSPAPPQTAGSSEPTLRPLPPAPILPPVIDPSILLIADEQRAYSRIANPTVDQTRRFQQRVRDIRAEALASQGRPRKFQGQQGGQDQTKSHNEHPPSAAASSAIPASITSGQAPLQWMPSYTPQLPSSTQSSTSGPTGMTSALPQPTFVLPGTRKVFKGPFNPSISQTASQAPTSVPVPMQTYGNSSVGSGPTTSTGQSFGLGVNGSSSAPICSGIGPRNPGPSRESIPTPGSNAAGPAASVGQRASQWAGYNDHGSWPAQEMRGRDDSTSGAWNASALSQTLPQPTPSNRLSGSMGATEMERASGSVVSTVRLGEYNHPSSSVQTASSWTLMPLITPGRELSDSSLRSHGEVPQHWWDTIAEIDSGEFLPRRYYSAQEWSQLMAFRDSLPGERLVMGNLPPDGRIPIEWQYVVEQMDRGVFRAQRPYTHHEWWQMMAFRNDPYRRRGLSLASPPPLPAAASSLGTAQLMSQQPFQQPAIQGEPGILQQPAAANQQWATSEPLGMSDADINRLNRQFILDGNSHVMGGQSRPRYSQPLTANPILPGHLHDAQFQTGVDQRATTAAPAAAIPRGVAPAGLSNSGRGRSRRGAGSRRASVTRGGGGSVPRTRGGSGRATGKEGAGGSSRSTKGRGSKHKNIDSSDAYEDDDNEDGEEGDDDDGGVSNNPRRRPERVSKSNKRNYRDKGNGYDDDGGFDSPSSRNDDPTDATYDGGRKRRKTDSNSYREW